MAALAELSAASAAGHVDTSRAGSRAVVSGTAGSPGKQAVTVRRQISASAIRTMRPPLAAGRRMLGRGRPGADYTRLARAAEVIRNPAAEAAEAHGRGTVRGRPHRVTTTVRSPPSVAEITPVSCPRSQPWGRLVDKMYL